MGPTRSECCSTSAPMQRCSIWPLLPAELSSSAPCAWLAIFRSSPSPTNVIRLKSPGPLRPVRTMSSRGHADARSSSRDCGRRSVAVNTTQQGQLAWSRSVASSSTERARRYRPRSPRSSESELACRRGRRAGLASDRWSEARRPPTPDQGAPRRSQRGVGAQVGVCAGTVGTREAVRLSSCLIARATRQPTLSRTEHAASGIEARLAPTALPRT